MRLLITQQAESDIEEIGDYIAQDNPHRALSFISELRGQCQKIALSPSAYRQRHELGEDIRSCAYGRYAIFFSHGDAEVRILRILHGARDIAAQFSGM
jgi:toxin ParE1/3/4